MCGEKAKGVQFFLIFCFFLVMGEYQSYYDEVVIMAHAIGRIDYLEVSDNACSLRHEKAKLEMLEFSNSVFEHDHWVA